MKFWVLLLCLFVLCGCNVKAAMDRQTAKEKAEKEEEAAKAPPPPPKANPGPDGKGIIGKSTDEVIDYRKAIAENPKLIEVDPKAKGNDYVSFLASAYVNVRSQVSMLGMEEQLKVIKVVEERNPSLAEIRKIMKDNGVKFTALPRYRKYAYDEKEGRFTILEDPDMKDAVHEGIKTD